MTHTNPRLAAAWEQVNGIPFAEAVAHRSVDESGPLAVRTNSPNRRALALGFGQGWEAAQHAILNAVTEFNNRYIVTHNFDQVATLAELSGAIEKIILEHAAVIRANAERKEAA